MSPKVPFVPSRHGADVEAGRRTGRRLRWMIRGDAEPDPERWRALGLGLMQGDPPADRLLEWMYEQGMQQAMPLFQRALDQGIGALPQAPPPLTAFFTQCEQHPLWVDDAKLAQGARVFQRMGMTSHYVLRDVALMGGYQASAFNKTLILTGALNGGAARRVAETMKWVVAATATGGMDVGAEGFRSTLHVRLIHAMIRRRVSRLPEWRIEELGLPINQTDMAATWLGFSALLLIGVRAMGVPVTRAEGHAVMHLWKFICGLMGVDERWLTDDETEARRLLYHMLLAQTPPDRSSAQLGRALMNETLSVPYPRFQRLRARFERMRHLSVTRYFTGSAGMAALGLPAGILPWYPLLSAPFTLSWHLAHRLVPGGRARAQRIGRQAHEDLLRLHFAGGREQLRPLQEV
ncbi:oxygenase MpaB family protein [Panacagrimonas sp.]|uniref:oxygenase MpaB family protein n=1 Tax=Panacagrimonas sp. TaxID=2480088 RepID=UPI003B520FD2